MSQEDQDTVQRGREWFHGLRVLTGGGTIVRVDGRSFSRFTEERFEKPFDSKFSELMVATATALMVELQALYAFTESDEISVLLRRNHDLFDRSVEKLVSLSAGIASASFTSACGEPAHFDSRLWLGTAVEDVVDYFAWRQADAARCALNGWAYWPLRNDGLNAKEATRRLERLGTSAKNELLFERGINFNDVPSWQRRAVDLKWETFDKAGWNPITESEVVAKRRRVAVERDLPTKDAYRTRIGQTIAAAVPEEGLDSGDAGPC